MSSMHGVIVDAYSTGRYLPFALARRGADCTHVQSSPQMPDFYRRTFPSGAFAASDALVHDGDLDTLAGELAKREPSFVVAGAETGVDLADELSARLGLPGNLATGRRIRRDKYEMAMAVRAHGLLAPDTLRTTRFEKALSWARAMDRWPLVVKPADSAGTDNVFVCRDTVEMCTAFDHIMGARNLMGFPNRTAVLQEFLAGTEYFANTVSLGGRHLVAEVWRYHKRPGRGGTMIYDYEEPLPQDDPAVVRIRPYLLGVLDALGIRNGPAHTEIMMTDRGPMLIETGARLAGSIVPEIVDRCFGTNHVDLTAEALTDPAAFDARRHLPARPLTPLRYVSLISHVSGRITSLAGADRIRDLPSFAGLTFGVDVGDRIVPTVDSASSPGVCYLVHEDAGRIEADYRTLRSLEESGAVYEVG
jgi:biotin carboxylase